MINIPTNMVINAEDAARIARAIRHDWGIGLMTGLVIGFCLGVLFTVSAVMRIARSSLANQHGVIAKTVPVGDDPNCDPHRTWSCTHCMRSGIPVGRVCDSCGREGNES